MVHQEAVDRQEGLVTGRVQAQGKVQALGQAQGQALAQAPAQARDRVRDRVRDRFLGPDRKSSPLKTSETTITETISATLAAKTATRRASEVPTRMTSGGSSTPPDRESRADPDRALRHEEGPTAEDGPRMVSKDRKPRLSEDRSEGTGILDPGEGGLTWREGGRKGRTLTTRKTS